MKVDEQVVVNDKPEEVKQQEDEDGDGKENEDENEYEEDNQEYKTYTIKPFKNSDGEYFGLTIKGRTKEYLNAHAKIKEMITKGKFKKYFVKKGELKILDITQYKSSVRAIIQVQSMKGDVKGSAELKVHNPSTKQKGATIEFRKIADNEYCHTELLRDIIEELIDGLVSGKEIGQIVKNSKGRKNLIPNKVTSNPRQFACDECGFETKFASGLKAHKKKIHEIILSTTQVICNFCRINEKSPDDLKAHIESKHRIKVKRSKEMEKCQDCCSTFEGKAQLFIHQKNQHQQVKGKSHPEVIVVSPSSSPPRKKQEIEDNEEMEVDLTESIFNCCACDKTFTKKYELEVHSKIHTSKNYTCCECDKTFQFKENLDKHARIHASKRKINDPDVEMIDVEISANDMIINMLENRIRQLETDIVNLQKREEEYKKEIQELKSQKTKQSAIPKHLNPVQARHLPYLKGYRMIYKVFGNGACAQNATAVHLYEDEEEANKVKKKVNEHIADNFDNYYQHRMVLPYTETVGVGKHSKTITVTTAQEMKAFLKSEDALMVYSNCHDLEAIANVFNIKIKIFTFRGESSHWSEIHPDPQMVEQAAIEMPEMALYHSDECHYDLLIKDDSRLAQLGLLAGSFPVTLEEDIQIDNNQNNDWKKVEKKRDKEKRVIQPDQSEEKLMEDSKIENNTKDVDEEITLLGYKNGGYKRTGPQENSKPNLSSGLKCKKCTSEFQSEVQLETHMKMHTQEQLVCSKCNKQFNLMKGTQLHEGPHGGSDFICWVCANNFPKNMDLETHSRSSIGNTKSLNYNCTQCQTVLYDQKDLDEHIRKEHENSKYSDEWNCNDCAYQANHAEVLIKHLKEYGHQPSKNIEKKKYINDYKQCYTCKSEFDGYNNLMNHRRDVHPSRKACRNFPGDCPRGDTCWFVHAEKTEPNATSEQKHVNTWNFKCDMCGEEILERKDFMNHKKEKHEDTVSVCEDFLNGKCSRSPQSCWFKHNLDSGPTVSKANNSQMQGFQVVPQNTFPPDLMSQIMQLINNLMVEKMENMMVKKMEKKFQEMN